MPAARQLSRSSLSALAVILIVSERLSSSRPFRSCKMRFSSNKKGSLIRSLTFTHIFGYQGGRACRGRPKNIPWCRHTARPSPARLAYCQLMVKVRIRVIREPPDALLHDNCYVHNAITSSLFPRRMNGRQRWRAIRRQISLAVSGQCDHFPLRARHAHSSTRLPVYRRGTCKRRSRPCE